MYVVIGAIVIYVLSMLVNILFTLPFFGSILKTIKSESDKLKTSATPIGTTFLIWNIIYIGQIGFIIIQSIQYINQSPPLQIYLFALIAILNGMWVIAFSFERIMLSVTILFSMLAALFYQYQVLEINYYNVSIGYFFSTAAPHSIYLAWVSLACILNVFGFMKYTAKIGEDDRLNSEHRLLYSALNILGVASMLMIIIKQDYVFFITICWGVLGIYLNGNFDNALFIFGCGIYFVFIGIGVFFNILVINKTFS